MKQNRPLPIGLILSLLLIYPLSALASGFAPPVIYQADQGPIFVSSIDVNGDGVPDLLVANNASNDISVLIGNTDSTFQSAVNYSVGLGPTSIAVGYFNGDSYIDLAVANSGSNNVSILLGNGDGTFQTAVNYSVGKGTSPQAIITSIFTNSGRLDLAVANSSGGDTGAGNVAILFGNGDGTFQSATNLDTAGKQPVALAPVNLGSSPAFAAANFATDDVTLFTSNLMGGFTITGNFPVGGTGPIAISPWLFQAAGNLVVANSVTNDITVLYQTGATFGNSRTFSVGATPTAVVEGIFNQNRKALSFVVANQADSTVSVFPATQSKPYIRKPISVPTCQSPKSVAAIFTDYGTNEGIALACSNGVGVMLNTGP